MGTSGQQDKQSGMDAVDAANEKLANADQTPADAAPSDQPAVPGVKMAPPAEGANDASGAQQPVGRPDEGKSHSH